MWFLFVQRLVLVQNTILDNRHLVCVFVFVCCVFVLFPSCPATKLSSNLRYILYRVAILVQAGKSILQLNKTKIKMTLNFFCWNIDIQFYLLLKIMVQFNKCHPYLESLLKSTLIQILIKYVWLTIFQLFIGQVCLLDTSGKIISI